MIQLMIVDDEKHILDGLIDLFAQQDDLELELHKASSAFEALALLAHKKIDLVLTDIHMPKMSGLELMEQIRGKWPHCKIIFLTGYDEFDYVYKAIQDRNANYILKLDGDSRIIQAVKDGIRELEESLTIETLLADAQEVRKRQSDYMRSLFFTDLLEGLLTEADRSEHELQQLHIPLRRGEPVLVGIVRLEDAPAGLLRREMDDLFLGLQAICRRYLSPMANMLDPSYNRTYLVLLMQPHGPEKSAWDSLITFIRGTMGTIQQACSKNLDVSISFSWKTAPVQWDSIPQTFSYLKLLFLHYSQERQIIVTEHNMAEIEKLRMGPIRAEHQQPLKREIGRLSHYFDTAQKTAYFQQLEAIEELVKELALHHTEQLEVCYALSLHGIMAVNRLGIGEEPYYRDRIKALRAAAVESDVFVPFLQVLRQLAESLFDFQESQGIRIQDDAIIKIKRYIKTNLKEDLSLTRLAELVHLNPDYLSRLFKQREGETVSDYITAQKILEAKTMLRENADLIQDVARRLGFSTAGYFTRFFKKETGLTPEEYRSSGK
ncbi:response regulator [Paenibacillus pasadenensis]|uniref:response regulator n=1 Tax=Paenibacillus pasadenensis TaxID=217090 RepID=UPI00203BFEFC|nr:response regulator [Paenibacillus pasadenensis]MCM3745738.1 response regulator [Paenibacillus pasadenensis]